MSISDKLTAIGENMQAVYDAGKTTEYDAFWDAFQQNGTRTDYTNTFGGRGWTTANFRPKYDLRPSIANRMFHYNTIEDLEGHLQSLGITLDTSGVTGSNMQAMFMNSLIVTIPEINATGVSDIANMFAYCTKLVTIRKLKLRSTGGQTFGTSFRSSANIENITIEGMITKPIDFSSCTKLTHTSLMSIINALGTVSTTTVCTLGTTNLNKLTAAEKAVATGRGWTLE